MTIQNPDTIVGLYVAARTGIAAADSDTHATFIAAHDADTAGGVIDCTSRSSIAVFADFSATTITATARVLFYRKDLDDAQADAGNDGDLIGMSDTVTINATAVLNVAGRGMCPVTYIGCEGFDYFRVKLQTLSAGNANLFAATTL